jgi:hypothetical protein
MLTKSTHFRTRRNFLLNADSQQYIFTMRIDLIISDIVVTRSSVTAKILVLKLGRILFASEFQENSLLEMN